MKPMRWSLRTAVILIAVIGLCLGVIAKLRSRAVAHQAAIEAIDRRHGGYGFSISGPWWYRALVLRLGGNEKMFYDPVRVSLGPGCPGYNPSTPIVDADIEALAKHFALLTNITIIDLRGTEVTDRGIGALPPLLKLKVIMVGRTAVTKNGEAEIRRKYPECEIDRGP
jgi:hypothetical protein